MRILVCIKQTPDTLEPAFSAEAGTLVREQMGRAMNPFDPYALEAAARWKDELPDTQITAISMGPDRAASILRDALALCADEAYLLRDPRFAGSDAGATALILAAAVRKLGPFDFIFTGAKSSDGGTAAVGPLLAGLLGIPVLSYGLTLEREGDSGLLTQETEAGSRELRVHPPCLITFTKAGFHVRYPLIPRILQAERRELPVLAAEDLPGLDLSRIGPEGSGTRVLRMKRHTVKKAGHVISGRNPALAVEKLGKELAGII